MSDLSRHIGVILAGGLGKRMGGGDKPLVTLSGKPMLNRVIERLRPQVEQIVLNANGDPARFDAYDLPVIADTIDGFAGPLAGLLAGMRWVQTNAPDVRFLVTVAADTPFIPPNLVQQLADCGGDAADTVALAASPAGTHPVIGRWPVALADDLETFMTSGEHAKILIFADRYIRLNVPFDDIALPNGETIDPFFNVNTPEDAVEAEVAAAAIEGHAA